MQPCAWPQMPEKVRSIHFTAICGTAMGALAGMLADLGYSVTGSDQHVYPPMSDFLKAKQIPVFDGYKQDNLAHRPDLVIVGNAVSKDNPEVRAMIVMGLPFCSMPQAINHFAAQGKQQIVVTGTHGKTTTSAFISWLLQSAGLAPSFLVGGITTNFKSNYTVGDGKWIVLEGDEYDTAYFDKGPKFQHYSPSIAILTSIEFDHADIFRDVEHVEQVFARFIETLPSFGALIACGDDPLVRSLLSRARVPVMTYGRCGDAQWRLGRIEITPPYTKFEVLRHGKFYGAYKTLMIGEHNLKNMLSGIVAGHLIKLGADQISRGVETFQGTRRRQEVRGVVNGVTVIDDFAHHPTAVRETLRAVKGFYKGKRIIAVFEPRTNSSRRNIFQNIYPFSFSGADLVCIRQAPLLEKIPDGQRFSSQKLVDDLVAAGKAAFFFPDTDGIIAFLIQEIRPNDVILVMSNGGFDNIHTRLLEAVQGMTAF